MSRFPDSDVIDTLRPDKGFSLEGRVALVTGATGGIGGWLAAGLGAAGASVMVTGQEPDGLEELARSLQTAKIEVAAAAVDLSHSDAADRLVSRTLEAFGRIDVLVNNAGINARKPILEVTTDDFDAVMTIDLRVPYFLSQAVVRVMSAEGTRGSIVNVSSINAVMGLERVSVYGAAKAGLSQLTRVMALEWARLGVRANAIAPGFIESPLVAQIWADPDTRRWIKSRVPLERLGSPHELVGLCQLLASDAGSFITGQTFFADGGLLAGGRWFTPDE
jgi:NAD(P)-dependent dehydrogenase (short-subunit alcohol dehydrogenase family)